MKEKIYVVWNQPKSLPWKWTCNLLFGCLICSSHFWVKKGSL